MRLPPALATCFTGRTLHTGFLAALASGNRPGALFEPMQDGNAIDGGWRKTAGRVERARR